MDEEKKLKTKNKNKNPSNRIFRGNINYVNYYNQFVQETFDDTTTCGKCSLKTSKITSDGNVYYLFQDKKTKNNLESELLFESDCPGSKWTPKEKHFFFVSLAKYSIHQISIIKSFLPKKSTIEIMNYYNLLKKELIRYKSKKKLKNYTYNLNNKIIKTKFFNFYRKLLKYDDMPIAYEMSENFIKYEEIQSDLIFLKERTRINDENRHFNIQFKEYINISDSNEQKNEVSSNLSDPLQNDLKTIFNLNNFYELSKNYLDYDESCVKKNLKLKIPSFHLKSLVFFEELTILFVKKLVYALIKKKLMISSLQSKKRKVVIKKEFILNFLNDNKIFEHHSNLIDFYNSLKDNEKNYKNKSDTSQPNVKLENDILDLNSNFKQNNDIVMNTIFLNSFISKYEKKKDSLFSDYKIQNNFMVHFSSLKTNYKNNFLKLVKKLSKLNHFEEIENDIIYNEDIKLEEADLSNSRLYEYGVSNFFLSDVIHQNKKELIISENNSNLSISPENTLPEKDWTSVNLNLMSQNENSALENQKNNKTSICNNQETKKNNSLLSQYNYMFANYS